MYYVFSKFEEQEVGFKHIKLELGKEEGTIKYHVYVNPLFEYLYIFLLIVFYSNFDIFIGYRFMVCVIFDGCTYIINLYITFLCLILNVYLENFILFFNL